MKDPFGRTIDYMRISFTDRCNLRCGYCMPENIELLPMENLLSIEEIVLICKEAVEIGIRKFKITGGEPLVRKGCSELIRKIKGIPGVQQVTMTTNGVLLREHLDELMAAGLDAVNISLDTLDPKRYAQITGRDELHRVLASIDTALERGMKVKINAVLQQGVNDDEWRTLAELAKSRPLDVRFIEMMPIGYGKKCRRLSNDVLLARMREAYPKMHMDNRIHGNGPAVYYEIPRFIGSIGMISAIHGVFCSTCNRIRMTSTGEIKPCLCYGTSLSVREAARKGDRAGIRSILSDAISQKPEMHCFHTEERITEGKIMAKIGG